MKGSIIQVNLSQGGLPKRPATEAWLTPLGFDGDRQAHPQIHGGPLKAVLLIPAESTDELTGRGYPLFYGALGENLTTRGLNPRDLRGGQRFRAGEAVIEITQPRRPCSALDVYGSDLGKEIDPKGLAPGDAGWGLSGFYASVVTPGRVRPGDEIQLVDAAA